MIIGNLSGWEKEHIAFHPVLNEALMWLKKSDLSTLKSGKYNILPDDMMFCMIQEYETQHGSQRRPESHFIYVDIQLIISGSEIIGTSFVHPECIVDEQEFDNDIVFYNNVINEQTLTLQPNMFAIFFPNDIHRPGCQVMDSVKVRKAVMKIHTNLIS